jgi:hypothetical protein
MVRSRNENSIHILTREDLTVIAGCEDIRTPQFFCMCETAIVAISYRDEFDARHLDGYLGIMLTLYASANQSELNIVIRRARCG